MAPKINLTGQVFNRWTVLKFSHSVWGGRQYWDCVCKCGTKRKVVGSNLINEHSKSCGCYKPQGGDVIEAEVNYEYVPICKERIDFMLEAESDYFERDDHESLFDTFIYLSGDRSGYRPNYEEEPSA